jgi:hypothetical protein
VAEEFVGQMADFDRKKSIFFTHLILLAFKVQIVDVRPPFNIFNFLLINFFEEVVASAEASFVFLGENSLRSTKFLSQGHLFHVLVLKGLISLRKVIQSDTWPKLYRWYLFSSVLKTQQKLQGS